MRYGHSPGESAHKKESVYFEVCESMTPTQVRWVSRERTSPLQDYTNMTLASFDTLANFFSAFATAGLGSPLRPRT